MAFMPMGDPAYASPAAAANLELTTFFPGKGLRRALTEGLARPWRVPISAIPSIFDSGRIRADVVLLQLSPPDDRGYCSLGVSVDYMHAVLRQSPAVFAEINRNMPRTRGDTLVHASAIDWFIETASTVQEVPTPPPDEVDLRIAVHVASLVRDGAVLQVGIGSLPDCVLSQLGHLKHLGLHTGIITDAAVPLIEAGVIDNSTKTFKPGCSVTTLMAGTRRLYDFAHENPAIELHACSVTHGAEVLSSIDGLCAINGALQVDLAGNVNAEEVNGRKIAMPGGQPDFAAGACRSRGGISIVAMRSTSKGKSNIVATLAAAAPITATAGVVDFVVTEHGIARVRGTGSPERAASLIGVADPAWRDELARQWSSSPSRQR